MEKVKKYRIEHTVGYKKRKEREYESFAKEVEMRAKDIAKNFVYLPNIAINESNLVQKVKNKVNKCIYSKYGCPGNPSHKINQSKHCLYYGLDSAALDAAKADYLSKHKDLSLVSN